VARCGKIDVAALGNVVPLLHIPIVARRQTDSLWPKPVFGVTPLRRGAAAFTRFVGTVREKLGAAEIG